MRELWSLNANSVKVLKKKDRYGGISGEELDCILGKIDAQAFSFSPMTRVYIPKSNKPGQSRPITMPFKKDILVMDALLHILTEVYEPVFLDCSHGFRVARGVPTFCAEVASWSDVKWVIQADFVKCFDVIPHTKLLAFLSGKIKDKRIMNLLSAFCECSIFDTQKKKKMQRGGIGIPQGCSVSPIMMNIFCHQIDLAMKTEFSNFYYARYADDFLLASTEPRDEARIKKMRWRLGVLLSNHFLFKVETKVIFPGGKPAKVLGVHLSINTTGQTRFHAIFALIKSRILKAHEERRELTTKDWNNKIKGYLTLYACCDSYRELAVFLQKKSRKLLDGTEDKTPSHLRHRSSGRISWAEALRFLIKARLRYISLVEQNKRKAQQ